MQRYKILIEYDGTDFSGWQRQDNAISVQQVLEESISKFSGEKTEVFGAGRTDSGVHAIGQVAHFDIEKTTDEAEIIGAINYHSKPHKVCILACEKVSDDFHARFSAVARSYVYKIINRTSPLILDVNRAWQVVRPLDFAAMEEAVKYFIGTHDFTSFRASECQAKSPIKTITSLELEKTDAGINLYIKAPSFLHHMVRNIVGTLVDVGYGKTKPLKIKDIIEAKNRKNAGPTAPAAGLYFERVWYTKTKTS